MTTQSNASVQKPIHACRQSHTKQLKEQVKALAEWKVKAKIQLEYFRTACSIYKFCDVSQVNSLLHE